MDTKKLKFVLEKNENIFSLENLAKKIFKANMTKT